MNAEQHASYYVNDSILIFDKWDPATLKKHMTKAIEKKALNYSKENFLWEILERAENLECYNVCIVIRDILKNLGK